MGILPQQEVAMPLLIICPISVKLLVNYLIHSRRQKKVCGLPVLPAKIGGN